MALSSKDLKSDGYDYKIDVATQGKGIKIDRTFTFRSGETVSFTVFVSATKETTLVDLNNLSLDRAIEMIQAIRNPDSTQETAQQSLANRLP